MKSSRLIVPILASTLLLGACASKPEKSGLFSKADSNRDGYVSMNEWQQTGGNDIAFMAADRDRTGRLTEPAFYEAIRLNQQSQGNSEAQKRMNDSHLAQQVKNVLSSSRDINGYAIKVDVYNGVVTLSGTVRTQTEKQKAEDLATSTPGVTQVFNSIAIKY